MEDLSKDRNTKPLPAIGRRNSGGSGPQKVTARDRAAKRFKAEPNVKEEGEISDTDEGGLQQQQRGRGRTKESTDRQSKEEKWHEWCSQMMDDQSRTLERLQKLQTDFALPKEEVVILISLLSIVWTGWINKHSKVDYRHDEFLHVASL